VISGILGDLLIAAYGDVPLSSSVDERLIVDAEQRIGASLPGPLRDFYRIAGKSPAVMTAYHQFVPVGELEISDAGLVFCRAHQQEIVWGVWAEELTAPDPRVIQGPPRLSGWREYCKLVSMFLINFSCWQIVNSMPSMGSTRLGPTTIKKLRKQMRVVAAAFGYDMISFVSLERGAVGSILLNLDRLYLAARDDASLGQLERSLGLDLDWA
jgi:hypothetical protein